MRETRESLIAWCGDHSACAEAVSWLCTLKEKTAQSAWNKCTRGDWMLWLAARRGVSQQTLVLCACDFARTALKYVQPGEDRPRLALEAAESWASDPSEKNKRAAAAAAAAADAAAFYPYAADAYAHAAAYSAAYAAYSAAYAAAYAAYAAYSAYDATENDVAAAYDATSDAYAAADAAYAARIAVRKLCADLIRKRIQKILEVPNG